MINTCIYQTPKKKKVKEMNHCKIFKKNISHQNIKLIQSMHGHTKHAHEIPTY